MRMAVTGSTGLIGSALVRSLLVDEHEVVRLVRPGAQTGRREDGTIGVAWNPAERQIDAAALEGIDGVVHLAGAGVGDKRWTSSYKNQIMESRRLGTSTLARALAGLDRPPSVLVSASAVGYYGQTGDQPVTEDAPAGTDFLAEVCRVWESSADPAREAGIRVVHPRTGLVFDRSGGAAAKLLPLFRLGLGGKLGSGRQWWSLISLADEVGAIRFLLGHDEISGPVNLTGPTPVTNAQLTAELARQLKRPAVVPVPSFALRIALGEMAVEVIGSQRVLPSALERAGYRFRHPDLPSIVTAGLGRLG
ncbi:TIGR01777 family oxidoreductase [Tessaracoccus caeni]|uniref:TIGR01777 family oxidoreductase n=1 Tax=Tessaracoccus caeni TaxID=3031239 RepID=UPI0023DC5B9B|nr:TIGR01777 family oxidoreductase [Tessaracoccus caeni]MDF1487791.1 TIGR01777 family oxidoreductase [Tessaracoccus caeni]